MAIKIVLEKPGIAELLKKSLDSGIYAISMKVRLSSLKQRVLNSIGDNTG
jgi:hypothetical protein